MYSTVLFLWIVTLTHCVLAGNICSKPPEVPFATIDVDKKEYQPGEEVTYTCRPGYVHQSGTKKYVCNWSGRWLLNTMKCTPKKCPFPGLLENGKISFTELTFQSTISFSCNPGYILNGARISQCMADGRWSGTPPHCQPVTCPPPQIPEFGVILYHTLKPGNVSVFQDMIRFECLPSFALLGNETAMCTANGNWSNIPECKYVTCPTPTGIENGFINFVVRRTYGYKERVSFGCNGRYVLDGPRESMCEKTSDWSIKPSCKAPCKIPVKKATVLYKGEKVAVQDGLKEGIQHDETISFFCKNKEKDCVYTVPASCIDGNLTVPECFKERGFFSSVFKKDYAERTQCEDVP
ncbi:beta-2-glycoprotein 1 [Alligator sinensis]|uniref:Beta-2-glycoprotein 1 n=1 Tax=Alligator sinensis TaxID=38654 RepID=A0A1U7R4Y5_ALLSI|nr:beta-2-glycoprotein 1 [Alligator sinensis]